MIGFFGGVLFLCILCLKYFNLLFIIFLIIVLILLILLFNFWCIMFNCLLNFFCNFDFLNFLGWLNVYVLFFEIMLYFLVIIFVFIYNGGLKFLCFILIVLLIDIILCGYVIFKLVEVILYDIIVDLCLFNFVLFKECNCVLFIFWLFDWGLYIF